MIETLEQSPKPSKLQQLHKLVDALLQAVVDGPVAAAPAVAEYLGTVDTVASADAAESQPSTAPTNPMP